VLAIETEPEQRAPNRGIDLVRRAVLAALAE